MLESCLASEAEDHKKKSYLEQRALQLNQMYETLKEAAIGGHADAEFVGGFIKEGGSSGLDGLEAVSEGGESTDHASFYGVFSSRNWLVLTGLSLLGYGVWNVQPPCPG